MNCREKKKVWERKQSGGRFVWWGFFSELHFFFFILANVCFSRWNFLVISNV